jgi:hypothetical protein
MVQALQPNSSLLNQGRKLGFCGSMKEFMGRSGSDLQGKALLIPSKKKRLVHPIKGFVYDAVGWDDKEKGALVAEVRAREGSQGKCSGCNRKGPGYDKLTEQRWRFVPLWGLVVWLVYTHPLIHKYNTFPRKIKGRCIDDSLSVSAKNRSIQLSELANQTAN